MLSQLLGLGTTGQPGSEAPVLAQAQGTGSPPLHLRVLPDRQELGRKYIVASTEDLQFSLTKMHTPARSCQYVWEVSDQQAAFTEVLIVTYDGTGDNVVLQGKKGDTMTTINLCRSSYYTVIKFTRGNKSYRWAMTGTDASKSPTQLRIKLLEEGSKNCLACISGPGFQRKKFWVQQPEPDVICAMNTEDRTWLQMIVATAMIAAKTQRHKDKVTSAARRNG